MVSPCAFVPRLRRSGIAIDNVSFWCCRQSGRTTSGWTTSGRASEPRWRLARECPFLSELPHSGVGSFGRGCAFRRTTYRSSDSKPSGEYGLPLHHPGFWNGSELRSQLDYWIKVLVLGCTRCPVNRPLTLPANFTGTYVYLIMSNLSILDQYILYLQDTTTKNLELTLGSRDFLSTAVELGAMVPRVRRVPIHMEAMGLWRHSLDSVGCP